FREASSRYRIEGIGRDVGQRLQHERLVEFRARDAQAAGSGDDPGAEQHDVHAEGAVRVTRHVAATTVTVLERMEPTVQRDGFEVAVEADREVDEIRPVETDRARAIRG